MSSRHSQNDSVSVIQRDIPRLPRAHWHEPRREVPDG
jgi:hypothetical protein